MKVIKNLFSNLFGGSNDSPPANIHSEKTQPLDTVLQDNSSTAPLNEDQLAELNDSPNQIEPQQFIVGVGRDVGRHRENNEDAIFTLSVNIDADGVSMPFGIYIVADGMGGHENGQLASSFAARTMGHHLISKLHAPLFGPDPHSPSESLQEILKQGVYDSHQKITDNAPGGGTTLTAVMIIGTQMTIAHVGDSRAYSIFLDGRIQTLTRDHSLVQRLQELGQITAEEAEVHPQKSMLYRALGQGEAPEPDIFTASLAHPGYLMICSDGLWGVITEEEIYQIITSAPNPHSACQSMVDAANNAGGPDNISVILVRMSD